MSIDLQKIHTIVFDFDGVFTDNFLTLDENGVESVRCSRADGLGISMLRNTIKLKKLDIDFFVLSTELNQVVLRRCEKLRIACHQGVIDKLKFLDSRFSDRNLMALKAYEGLIYFGNDLNDLQIMERCAYSFAPIDAHPRVLQAATHVLEHAGGHDFVRHGIELLLEINKMTTEEINELISNR